MADVKDDEDKTLDQSNSGASDTATDDSVDDSATDDSSVDGNASDDDASDDTADTGQAEEDADRQTRGERRHERYIDKLGAEIRESNLKDTRYTEDIFSPKPYEPLQYKEGDFDAKELEADRKQVADNRFAEGVQTGITQGTTQVVKELWADRLDIDSERVSNNYDVLNPDDKAYNPELEASLVQKYIAFTGVEQDAQGRITIQKPNIRFRDFVQAEMKNLEDFAAARNAASQKNVAKQAAHTGVRPSGQARVPKGDHGFDENDPVGSVNRMSSKQYFEMGGKEASDAYLAKIQGR